MKKLFLLIIMLFPLSLVYSQETNDIRLKVTELKGIVDIKTGEDKWSKPAIGDIISADSQIITGFHSQITLQAEDKLFITINQLSSAKVVEIRIGRIENAKNKKEVGRVEVYVNVNLERGYAVLFSKKDEKIIYRSIVSFQNGSAEFNDTGGEIYYRNDKGALIKSFSGRLLISAKLNKRNFINKGEICCILPSGVLLDNDYFLRQNINAKPSSISNEPDIIAYYNYITLPYTSNNKLNDYSDQFRP